MQMPIAGGNPKQLSDKLIELGVFSPDGEQIAALTEEGTGVNTRVEIAILPAQGGLPVKTFPPAFGFPISFSTRRMASRCIIRLQPKEFPIWRCSRLVREP